jgi:BolA protein
LKERIVKKLEQNLIIKDLKVINKSHLHIGHMENAGGGETHFEVMIAADELNELSLIQAHRRIKDLLKEEIEKNGLHSLSIKILK